MKFLDILPREIWKHEIFEFFTTLDLIKLERTCKFFRDLTIENLKIFNIRKLIPLKKFEDGTLTVKSFTKYKNLEEIILKLKSKTFHQDPKRLEKRKEFSSKLLCYSHCFRFIKKIDSMGLKIGDDGVRYFADKYGETLESINLLNEEKVSNSGLYYFLQNCPKLVELKIGTKFSRGSSVMCCPIPKYHENVFLKTLKGRKLRSIQLFGIQVWKERNHNRDRVKVNVKEQMRSSNGDLIRKIFEKDESPILSKLVVCNYQQPITTRFDGSFVGKFRNLKVLKLRHTKIGSFFENNRLEVYEGQLNDKQMEKLVNGSAEILRKLIMYEDPVPCEGRERCVERLSDIGISKLQNCKSLKFLHLYFDRSFGHYKTNISKKGMEKVIPEDLRERFLQTNEQGHSGYKYLDFVEEIEGEKFFDLHWVRFMNFDVDDF